MSKYIKKVTSDKVWTTNESTTYAYAKGKFNCKIKVHVKRIPSKDALEIERALYALSKADNRQENIVRFIDSEPDILIGSINYT
jgi:hypothetical protein